MSTPDLHQAILDCARTTMKQLASDSQYGLDPASAADRVLEVEQAVVGLRLRIVSDGLTLDHKMNLERALLRDMQAADFQIAGINFTRRTASTVGGNAPVSARPRPNPFGITVNKRAIPGVRHVIVVASGKGGVGKSTVSTNLAVALKARGLRVGLMDCDVYGPSAPLLLGVQGQIEVGPGGKLIPKIGHGIKIVSFGFLSDVRSPVIWRGPLVSKAVEQLCYDVDWGDLDTLVVDMPPGTGDVQLTIAEKLPVHAAVIVTTPQDVALIDAHKAVSMFERLEIPIAGVVENMAWYECSKCGHEEHIFGSESFTEFLKTRRLNLLSRVPLRKEIRLDSDSGTPPALRNDTGHSKPYHAIATAVAEYLRL